MRLISATAMAIIVLVSVAPLRAGVRESSRPVDSIQLSDHAQILRIDPVVIGVGSTTKEVLYVGLVVKPKSFVPGFLRLWVSDGSVRSIKDLRDGGQKLGSWVLRESTPDAHGVFDLTNHYRELAGNKLYLVGSSFDERDQVVLLDGSARFVVHERNVPEHFDK